MARKGKLGDLRGVGEWRNLSNAGDTKRLLRWLILSIRNQTIDPKVAAIMGQLAVFLLKTVETADLETQLQVLQTRIEALQQNGIIRGGQWTANGQPGRSSS